MGNSIFSAKGRIDRFSYFISSVVIAISLAMLNELLNTDSPAMGIFILYIPFYWCLFAQGAKRSHDLGNSGWLQLIPFYAILLLFSPGEKLDNKYGETLYKTEKEEKE